MRFRLVPKSMTLDDLERPKRYSCRNNEVLQSPTENNLNEDRPILSAAKCRLMIQFQQYKVYADISGVPRGGWGSSIFKRQ